MTGGKGGPVASSAFPSVYASTSEGHAMSTEAKLGSVAVSRVSIMFSEASVALGRRYQICLIASSLDFPPSITASRN
ncbi:unnamed protein product [Tuber aestivum]|uniref:Uncharacterized protein n=1 Tax=Tuber aestivum TaxID=59557 RepID=A0A292PNS9_9PEZI|nr:unnamed protein product [Tuber aestivum]